MAEFMVEFFDKASGSPGLFSALRAVDMTSAAAIQTVLFADPALYAAYEGDHPTLIKVANEIAGVVEYQDRIRGVPSTGTAPENTYPGQYPPVASEPKKTNWLLWGGLAGLGLFLIWIIKRRK